MIAGYWLELLPVKIYKIPKKLVQKKTKQEIHLGLYAGRNAEIEYFRNTMALLDNPDGNHILSFYGFGGVGKSTLIKILRDVALDAPGIIVKPRLPGIK